MSSLEAPSAWRPPNSGVSVPVPAPIPVPAPTQVNPAPPAYGGALQPPPYLNPTLRPGPPPVAAPRLGQPPVCRARTSPAAHPPYRSAAEPFGFDPAEARTAFGNVLALRCLAVASVLRRVGSAALLLL